MTMVASSRIPLRERKKQATRARLVEAAIQLFSRRGFDAPTIDEIAAHADIGKGTLYNYFRTKEEIVVAYMVGIEAGLQARARRLARRRGSLASILTDFAWTHLQLKAPHRDFVRIVMTQLALQPPEIGRHFADLQRLAEPPLVELFSSLQARGALRKDVRVADLIMLFQTLQVGFTMVWLSDNPPYIGTRRVVESALRLFSEGLAGHSPAAARKKRR